MFPLPEKTLCKRRQNGQGRGSKKGRVKGEGFALKPLTFLAPEVKTIHDATNSQFSPSSFLLELSNGNKILPSHFQLNFTLARETQNLISGQNQPDIKQYSHTLQPCCQNVQRRLTVVGASKQWMKERTNIFPPIWEITFYCKLLSLPILGYQKENISASYVCILGFHMPSLCFVPSFPFHPENSAQKDDKRFIIPPNPRKPVCPGVCSRMLLDLWVQEGANAHLTSSLGALRRILQRFPGKEAQEGSLNSLRFSLLYQLIIFLTPPEALNLWVLGSSNKSGWKGPTGPKISSADI